MIEQIEVLLVDRLQVCFAIGMTMKNYGLVRTREPPKAKDCRLHKSQKIRIGSYYLFLRRTGFSFSSSSLIVSSQLKEKANTLRFESFFTLSSPPQFVQKISSKSITSKCIKLKRRIETKTIIDGYHKISTKNMRVSGFMVPAERVSASTLPQTCN